MQENPCHPVHQQSNGIIWQTQQHYAHLLITVNDKEFSLSSMFGEIILQQTWMLMSCCCQLITTDFWRTCNLNLCCMLWVKNYSHVHLKKKKKINSFNFWAKATKFYDFINISFLHVLTINQICWLDCSFLLLKLLQSQHSESFAMLKVMGEFSPMVYGMKVLLHKSHGWFFTNSVCHESFTK